MSETRSGRRKTFSRRRQRRVSPSSCTSAASPSCNPAAKREGRSMKPHLSCSDSESKGPYVWGKAESEILAREVGKKLGVEIRIIRPGPLVDYEAFEPPGRLGREVGRTFVYIGSKKSRLSLCDVRTAANVICAYVDDFDSMPPDLNLVEPDAPTRGELVSHLLKGRPDLKAVGFPFFSPARHISSAEISSTNASCPEGSRWTYIPHSPRKRTRQPLRQKLFIKRIEV